MSFSDDIKRWKQKTIITADKIFRGTCFEIFSKIIKRTPVKTGRLRGNWQAELNRIPTGDVDTKGNAALSGAAQTTGKAKITDSVYLVNNLPYAGVIENGRSNQAPAGMVKVTIAEFKSIVDKNARKNK